MEWIEVQAKTVDAAVAVAVEELGLDSVDQAQVEILQEPQRGFLGLGGTDAIVRVKPAPPRRKRRRRGGRRRGRGEGGKAERTEPERRRQKGQPPAGAERRGPEPKAKAREKAKETRRPSGEKARKGEEDKGRKEADVTETTRPPVDIEEQATVIREFVTGLVAAYGLEGDVKVHTEDDIVYVNVEGEHTEALVGPKGAIMQAILDLLKIVVQRKTQHRARIRIDIAGYTERRREALAIYTGRLSEQVLKEGGEVMLEPMNPADRKVVHDAVAAIEGVRSWSEGEEPNRSVIIGLAPGAESGESPIAGNGQEETEEGVAGNGQEETEEVDEQEPDAS